MKNNETGEFELVLGNRQLLSGFFIVVILFAVFFVMGYIVGRTSPPASQLAANRDQNSGAAAPSNTRPQPASGTAPAPQNIVRRRGAGLALSSSLRGVESVPAIIMGALAEKGSLSRWIEQCWNRLIPVSSEPGCRTHAKRQALRSRPLLTCCALHLP